jgi:predicted component of type VI protein secretion system
LQQVGPNKRGKPQPVDVDVYGQNKADEHKTARYTSNDSISHFF